MHERSMVQSLLTQVERLRIQHEAITVDAVTVEIGPLSGVEPELVRQAFDELTPERFTGTPALKIESIPLRIHCLSCGSESDVPGLSLTCPECESVAVQIVRGDEFRLIDVSMQIPVLAQSVRAATNSS